MECIKTFLTYQDAAAVLRHIGGGTEQDNTGTLVAAIMIMALVRGCHEDKTAFSATRDPIFEDSPPQSIIDGPSISTSI